MIARQRPLPVIFLARRPLAATDASAPAGATTRLAGGRDSFLGGGFGVGCGSSARVGLTPIFGHRPVERLGGGHAPPGARSASLRFIGPCDVSFDDRDSPCGDRWVLSAGVWLGS